MPRKPKKGSWPFNGNLALKHEFKVRIKQTLPSSMERFKTGAMLLSKPQTAGLMLKAAATETLLAAYRRRFLAALPGMVNLRREHPKRSDPVLEKALVRRFLEASQRYQDAQVRSDARAIGEARVIVDSTRERIRQGLQPPRRSKRPFPPGGFRRLALKVLDLVADVNEAHVFVQNASVVLGIGDLAALEQIRTPSATSRLRGRATSSTRDVLWRHLEFGTGAFATDVSQQSSTHRIASGGWWYGKSPDQSLELRGSKAGKMLGDPARKLANHPESVHFRAVLFQFMNRALYGDT